MRRSIPAPRQLAYAPGFPPGGALPVSLAAYFSVTVSDQADAQVRLMLDAYADRLLGEIRQAPSVLDRAPGVVAVTAGSGRGSAANRRAFSAQSGYPAAAFARSRVILHPVGGRDAPAAGVALLARPGTGIGGNRFSGSLARAFRRWTGQSPGEYRRQLKDH